MYSKFPCVCFFQVLESNKLTPIKLGPKEGIALINGTQLITALGVEGT